MAYQTSCSTIKDNLEDEDSQLTIDTKVKNNESPIIITGPGATKLYGCAHCQNRFTRLTNYRRHLVTHFGESVNASETENSDENTSSSSKKNILVQNKQGIYKCNMCPSSYLHAATLTKHIVTRHLNIHAT